MRALATDPAQRFATAESFGVALAGACTQAWGPGWLPDDVPIMGAGPIMSAAGQPSGGGAAPAPAEPVMVRAESGEHEKTLAAAPAAGSGDAAVAGSGDATVAGSGDAAVGPETMGTATGGAAQARRRRRIIMAVIVVLILIIAVVILVVMHPFTVYGPSNGSGLGAAIMILLSPAGRASRV
jgi:serine/threonine-protein kinase